MRVAYKTSVAGAPTVIAPGALLVCADNGTPLVVFADVGSGIVMRTADHAGFDEALHAMGFDVTAPRVEVEDRTGEPR